MEEWEVRDVRKAVKWLKGSQLTVGKNCVWIYPKELQAIFNSFDLNFWVTLIFEWQPYLSLTILPWHCVLHSVMRFWQRQTPCCVPPDQFPLRVLRISQEVFLIGRWLALTSGDVSCMATWCLWQRGLHPQVLSVFTKSDISQRGKGAYIICSRQSIQ